MPTKTNLTKLFEEFYQQGLRLVTKVRSNMKNQLLELDDKLRLKKRALIDRAAGAVGQRHLDECAGH